MYIYKVGYYSYEDSSYHELWHEREFTREQFEDMFIESVLQLLTTDRAKCSMLYDCEEGGITEDDKEFYEKQIKEHYNKTGVTPEEIFNYCKENCNLKYTNFSNIHYETVDLMVEKFGFKKVKYTAELAVDGWGGIVDMERHFGEDEEILDKISEKYWEIIKGNK